MLTRENENTLIEYDKREDNLYDVHTTFKDIDCALRTIESEEALERRFGYFLGITH